MTRETYVALLMALAAAIPVRAEVPLLSKAELRDAATHIVVGKVQTVFSTTTKTEDWVDSKSVAEIAVQGVEKGDRIRAGDRVYGRFWNRRWAGDGVPDPYSRGHKGPDSGQLVRAYLVLKEGAYEVVLPNGFEAVTEQRKQDAPSIAAKQDATDELAKVQGKWVRIITASGETYTVIKEHKGNKTTVRWLDPDGNVVAAKKSEFQLEQTDTARIFTFFNNVVTAGPQKGQTDNSPTSYIYRVVGDTFVEVNGLMIDDDTQPVVFTWKRVKE
jgi:hypothetical protein